MACSAGVGYIGRRTPSLEANANSTIEPLRTVIVLSERPDTLAERCCTLGSLAIVGVQAEGRSY